VRIKKVFISNPPLPRSNFVFSPSQRDPSKRHSAPGRRAPPSESGSGIVLLTGATGPLQSGTAAGLLANSRNANTGSGNYRTRATPARRSKRRRLSDNDISDDDDDDDDDDDMGGGGGRSSGPKYHKACSSCRKQKVSRRPTFFGDL
jgi:hypothetical protein